MLIAKHEFHTHRVNAYSTLWVSADTRHDENQPTEGNEPPTSSLKNARREPYLAKVTKKESGERRCNATNSCGSAPPCR